MRPTLGPRDRRTGSIYQTAWLLLFVLSLARAARAADAPATPRGVPEAERLSATNPAAAREVFRSLVNAAAVPEPLRLRAAHGWSACAITLRDYADVVEASVVVEMLATSLDLPRERAIAVLQRGAALQELGRHDDARRELRRAQEELRAVGCHEHEARCAHNLSLTLGALGDYAGALLEAEHAAETRLAAAEDDEIRVKALTALAATRLRVGDVDGARHAAQAAAVVARGRPTAQAIEAFGTLGQVHAQAGDLEDALSDLRQVLVLALPARAHPSALIATMHASASIAMMSVAHLHRDAGNFVPALSAAHHAVALAHGSPLLRAYALFEVGATLAARGDETGAVGPLLEAHTTAAQCGDADLQLACLTEEAVLYRRAGSPTGALERSLAALRVVEQSAAGLSDDLTAVGRAQRSRLFGTAVGAAADRGPQDAWQTVERCRAVGLLCSIGGGKVARATDRTAELEAALARDVAAEQAASRAAATRHEAPDATPAELRELRKRWNDAVAAVDAGRERLQREQGLHAATVPTKFTTPAEVRARLAPGHAFVSICTLDTGAFALVVERDRDDVRAVELGPTRELVARCLTLTQDAIDDEPTAAANAAATGRWILDRLALPTTVHTLVLSVDADLAAVPLGAALALGRHAPLAVAMMPSATVGTALAAYPPVRDRPALVAGVADYGFAYADTPRRLYLGSAALATLSTARAEAKAAAGATGVLLLDEEATEDAVRARLRDEAGWDAVHVVCHGLVHPRVPALSGLALRPGGTDDGFLDLREVLDLRVRTNLVVLAACQTGLGKVYAGEGIWGLGRAFMLAGAPRVLVSLWKVDDAATTELMGAFHDGRRAGLASAAALRRAQAFVRETPAWAHPRYWAAWQLWGLPD